MSHLYAETFSSSELMTEVADNFTVKKLFINRRLPRNGAAKKLLMESLLQT